MVQKKASLIVTLKDLASKGIRGIRKSLGSLAKSALSSKLSIVALAAGVGLLIKDFAAFEKKMVDVGNLFGATRKQVNELSKGVLEISKRVPQAAQDLAESLFDVVSAGVAVADSLKFLEEASKLAVAGVTDTKTAVDGLTSVMNAFGIAASDVQIISDKFFETQKQGKTTIQELSSTIGRLAPIASATGVSIDEMFASVAALTKQGISTAEAVVGVRSALTSVLKPTGDAEKAAERLGLEFNATKLEAVGLTKFLEDVKEATGGNTIEMAKLFGNVRALNAVLALSSDNFEELNNIQKEVQDSMGVTAEAFEKQLNTMSGQWVLFLNQLRGLANQIIGIFAPVIKGLLKLFNLFFKLTAKQFKFLTGQTEAQLKGQEKFIEKILDLQFVADSKIGQLLEGRLEKVKTLLGKEVEEEEKTQQKKIDTIKAAEEALAVLAVEKKQKEEEAKAKERELAGPEIPEELRAQREAELEAEETKNEKLKDLSSDLSNALLSNEQDKAKAIGNVLKGTLTKEIDAFAAKEIQKAILESFGTFGASLARIPLIIGAQAVAKGAIGAISFHEGGIVGASTASNPNINRPLRTNERSAILETGERVLTESTDAELRRLMTNLNNRLDALQDGPKSVSVQIDGQEVARAITPHTNSFQRLDQAGSV